MAISNNTLAVSNPRAPRKYFPFFPLSSYDVTRTILIAIISPSTRGRCRDSAPSPWASFRMHSGCVPASDPSSPLAFHGPDSLRQAHGHDRSGAHCWSYCCRTRRCWSHHRSSRLRTRLRAWERGICSILYSSFFLGPRYQPRRQPMKSAVHCPAEARHPLVVGRGPGWGM